MSLSDFTDARPLILVVDDNEQNRALVLATLEEDGHRVTVASGGAEALQAFDAEAPDCVLLDVRMPQIDGLAVCRAIRARPSGADVPIMFLTAVRDVETFDAALGAGGDDFLTKPVRPTELSVRVQAALKLGRLTAENREHYETIRRQRDAMMRLQLQKEELMAFVVHDLKNPVSTLDLHAQLMLRDAGLSPRSKNCALAIRAEAERLVRQINNLLDLSKIDEARLVPNLRAVDLEQLLADVEQSFDLRARAKELRLEVKTEALHVAADADLLRRVMENLVDNALRHAPQNSPVKITARGTPGGVLLTVADLGPGVPESAREAIFERFTQAEDAHGVKGSYGLGLAFCKLSIEQQKGRIWVEDGCPGATFCVRLPYAA
jgi:signal transduction histidine kinase